MLYALTRKEAKNVAHWLEIYIKHYGCPEILHCDNGREFLGAVLLLAKRRHIKLVHGRPRTPRVQGLVEQGNATSKAKITKWIAQTGNSKWHLAPDEVSWQMNNQSAKGLPSKLTPERVFSCRRSRKLPKTDKKQDALLASISEEEINNFSLNDKTDVPLNIQNALDSLPSITYENELDMDPESLAGLELVDLDVDQLNEAIDRQDEAIREHQDHRREVMKQQYAGTHQIRKFRAGDLVFLRIPEEDRADLDDRRILCRVIEEKREDQYLLQTQFGCLNRQYPTSELNAVPEGSEEIGTTLDNAPKTEITLHAAARKNSRSDKRSVSCKCKGKCGTRKCICLKEQVKCTQYCHKADRGKCLNLATIQGGTEAAKVRDTEVSEISEITEAAEATGDTIVLTERRKRAGTSTVVAPAAAKKQRGDQQITLSQTDPIFGPLSRQAEQRRRLREQQEAKAARGRQQQQEAEVEGQQGGQQGSGSNGGKGKRRSSRSRSKSRK